MARFDDSVDSSDLIRFAQAWAGLGSAVAEQVESVLKDSDSWSEQNPNALLLALERIGGYSDEIDGALNDALASFEREEGEQA